YLNEVSEAAKQIGAINTIIVVRDKDNKRLLLGDNTDWLGIMYSIERALKDNNCTYQGSAGLVIGAGGTSRAALYALHHLGISPIYLFNRTLANAQSLAATFPSEYGIIIIPSLSEPLSSPPQIIVSTIPATADVEIPKEILKFTEISKNKVGVIVEMAYKSRKTKLLQVAESFGNGRWIG
ncbi:2330_t:CDS:1, partial [Paraglomus occultum]